jgi:hypothetical protein
MEWEDVKSLLLRGEILAWSHKRTGKVCLGDCRSHLALCAEHKRSLEKENPISPQWAYLWTKGVWMGQTPNWRRDIRLLPLSQALITCDFKWHNINRTSWDTPREM